MKKHLVNSLFLFSGILWLFAGIISEDMRWGYALGFAFITLGIVFRKKEGAGSDSEEGELLTDEEEKQVWEEFQGKIEKDQDDAP